jgi:hypothetical protein
MVLQYGITLFIILGLLPDITKMMVGYLVEVIKTPRKSFTLCDGKSAFIRQFVVRLALLSMFIYVLDQLCFYTILLMQHGDFSP